VLSLFATRRLHDFGRLGVRIAEPVANRQRNRGRTVPQAPADGQNAMAEAISCEA